MITIFENQEVKVSILDFDDNDFYRDLLEFFNNKFWLRGTYIFPLKKDFISFQFEGDSSYLYRVSIGDFEDVFYGNKNLAVHSDMLRGEVELVVEREGKLLRRVDLIFVNYALFVYVISLLAQSLSGSLDEFKEGLFIDNETYLQGFERYIQSRFGFTRWENLSFEDFKNYVKEWIDSFLKRGEIFRGLYQVLNSFGYASLIEHRKDLENWLLGYSSIDNSKWVEEKL